MEVLNLMVMPGGAISGVAQTSFLKKFEEDYGSILSHINIIFGSSVGSINGGCLASGKISAKDLHTLNKNLIPEMWNTNIFRRLNPFLGRYRKEPLIRAIKEHIGDGILMSDLQIPFLSTAWCANLKRTVFFKSWEVKDGLKRLDFVVDSSSAAPVFFNAVQDIKECRTYLDGGIGGLNYPIQMALYEIMIQMLSKTNKVNIIVIGNGYAVDYVDYNKTKKNNDIKNAFAYFDPQNGGAAREEARYWQIKQAEAFAFYDNNVNFYNFDIVINKEVEKQKFSNIDYIDYWEGLGERIYDENKKYITELFSK